MNVREIKFRAWDKERKLWCDIEKETDIRGHYMLSLFGEVTEVSISTGELDIDYLSNIELVQYTGLKDKNGKEIYEGDILLFNNDYPNARKVDWKCVVKYRKGSFVCEYPKDGVYNHFDSWNVPKVTWEIIGNIYENPELLESGIYDERVGFVSYKEIEDGVEDAYKK